MKEISLVDFSDILPKTKESYITKKEYTAIIGAMRKVFARSEFAKEVRRSAISEKTGKRGGMMIDCAVCKEAFSPKEIEIHHLDEVVEIGKHYADYKLDELLARLWTEHDFVICLCKECHKEITRLQNIERKRLRDEEKKNE